MNHYSIIRLLIIVIAPMFSAQLFAQSTVQGRITDQRKKALPYANIGIKSSSVGSLSDRDGFYKLTLDSTIQPNDSIVFSMPGFLEKKVSYYDLKKNPNLSLDQKITAIEEVIVKPIKLKEKMIGEKNRPMLTFTKFFNKDAPTVEQGNVFTIYSTTKLKAYNFFIMPSSRFKELQLKLSIYDLKNGSINKNILNEAVIYTATTTRWQHIDLAPLNLMLKNNKQIAITLQLVDYKALDTEDFVFGISAKNSLSQNIIYRYQSQGQWEKLSGNLITNIEVGYNKTPNEEDPILENPAPILDEVRLHEKLKIAQHKDEAKKTNFGKDKTGKFLDVENGKIYYEQYGEGEALVLLHGNGGSISDFYKQIPFFKKHYQITAIDTRGQGRSANLSHEDYSYELFAKDLYTVLQQLQLPKVNIIGWSDGGNTALIFAKKHPELVNKMVLIGANLSPNGVEESLLNNLKEDFENPENNGDKRLLKLMLTQPNIDPKELNTIPNPTLVISGETDVIKKEHSELIAESLPTSAQFIIPKTGHYSPFEESKILNQKILEFLKK